MCNRSRESHSHSKCKVLASILIDRLANTWWWVKAPSHPGDRWICNRPQERWRSVTVPFQHLTGMVDGAGKNVANQIFFSWYTFSATGTTSNRQMLWDVTKSWLKSEPWRVLLNWLLNIQIGLHMSTCTLLIRWQPIRFTDYRCVERRWSVGEMARAAFWTSGIKKWTSKKGNGKGWSLKSWSKDCLGTMGTWNEDVRVRSVEKGRNFNFEKIWMLLNNQLTSEFSSPGYLVSIECADLSGWQVVNGQLEVLGCLKGMSGHL